MKHLYLTFIVFFSMTLVSREGDAKKIIIKPDGNGQQYTVDYLGNKAHLMTKEQYCTGIFWLDQAQGFIEMIFPRSSWACATKNIRMDFSADEMSRFLNQEKAISYITIKDHFGAHEQFNAEVFIEKK